MFCLIIRSDKMEVSLYANAVDVVQYIKTEFPLGDSILGLRNYLDGIYGGNCWVFRVEPDGSRGVEVDPFEEN